MLVKKIFWSAEEREARSILRRIRKKGRFVTLKNHTPLSYNEWDQLITNSPYADRPDRRIRNATEKIAEDYSQMLSMLRGVEGIYDFVKDRGYHQSPQSGFHFQFEYDLNRFLLVGGEGLVELLSKILSNSQSGANISLIDDILIDTEIGQMSIISEQSRKQAEGRLYIGIVYKIELEDNSAAVSAFEESGGPSYLGPGVGYPAANFERTHSKNLFARLVPR